MMKSGNLLSYLLLLVTLFFNAGCTQQNYRVDGATGVDNRNSAEKERVLLKTRNYESLITLNRESLQKKEDPEVRFRLSEYYYLVGNFNSSLHYLTPLLKNRPPVKVYLLQSKNLVAQKNYDSALKFVNMAIEREPNNAEGLNLRGIVLAEKGELKSALKAFEQARNAFYPEEKILNNMALVHIAERRYTQAIQLLLPLYLRGYRDNHMTHNLIFALVKSGDLRYAKEMIKRENLTHYPDTLVSSLFEIESNLASI
ncbi:hypothetical protein PMPD1_3526 [Paramixta manurensis]|uniref:Uncharacterized protein n=1 Tax=Paramixta manurensis TaxID=2740817 RepID=A0A6M8UTN4_9GAMM|nr:hypothetical protein PMPD1_3526 [Erwiniaceae bacterium PD-1]